MQRKIVSLQIRLPDELHAEIRRLTEEEDRPLNRTIVRLLRAGLEHYRGDSSHGVSSQAESEP